MAQGNREGGNSPNRFIILRSGENVKNQENKIITLQEVNSLIKSRLNEWNLSVEELAIIIEEPLSIIETLRENFEDIEMEVLVKILDALSLDLRIEIRFDIND